MLKRFFLSVSVAACLVLTGLDWLSATVGDGSESFLLFFCGTL